MKSIPIIARSDGKEKEIPESDFRDLDKKLTGRVVIPFDQAYKTAVTVWNGLVNTKPAAIVICSEANDVIGALRFAGDFEMSVSVLGGGHSVSGMGLLEGGMVLDLSTMNRCVLDEEKRQITVGGGTRFDAINTVTAEHGFAVPSGFVSMMGVGGISLRGGLGPLMRKYGLTCDSIDSLRFAGADGSILPVSNSENSELFWALKGGPENLGVVTDFTFNLRQITTEVTRIYVGYPIQSGKQVLKRIEEYISSAPPEVGLNVHYASVGEDTKETAKDRAAIIVYGVYFGSPGNENAVVDPLRKLGSPIFDKTDRMLYAEAQRSLDNVYPHGRRYYWRSLFVDHLSDELLEVMAAYAQNRTSQSSKIAVWPMGGEVRSKDRDSSAIPFRDASLMIAVEANWDDAAKDAKHIQWGIDAWSDMGKYATGSVYLNFAGAGHEPKEAALRGVGFDHDRLSKVKNRYDPQNFFK